MLGWKPNTILYACPQDSAIAKEIQTNDIGIFIHTKMVGDSYANLKAVPTNGSISLPKASGRPHNLPTPKLAYGSKEGPGSGRGRCKGFQSHPRILLRQQKADAPAFEVPE